MLGLLFCAGVAEAQPYRLTIVFTDSVFREKAAPRMVMNDGALKKEMQQELLYWQKQNFVEASFDSIATDSAGTKAYLRLGPQYRIEAIEHREKKEKGKAGGDANNYSYWVRKVENTLVQLESNGYPFAQVTVKRRSVSSNTILLELHTDSGAFITYDSLILTGNSTQDPAFISRYLNLKPGEPYNEAAVKQLDKQLRQLPFVKVARPSVVFFHRNKASVMVCIDDKPSSSFEGIVGIRNDELNARQYKVTGDANLFLGNLFASAASLKLQWRRFAARNADILGMAYYPYLFGAPVALNNEFSLFRQDSNFQRLKNNAGFSYLFNGLNAVQFYYSYEKSTATLTTAQRELALNQNTLPSVNDYLNKNYGVKFIYKNLDNLFSPTQGMNLFLDISAGTHRILENSTLKNAKMSNGSAYSVYDSLPRQRTAFQTSNLLDYYISLSGRNVLNIFAQGASMYHPSIFYNEQYQLGGLRTFRGVNELSIKSTSYVLLRAEYRYILPQTGYFNLFCNGIWYESNIVNSYTKAALFGAGGGLGIQTKGGLLTVVYALANENGFVFKYGKVHIGFTAVF